MVKRCPTSPLESNDAKTLRTSHSGESDFTVQEELSADPPNTPVSKDTGSSLSSKMGEELTLAKLFALHTELEERVQTHQTQLEARVKSLEKALSDKDGELVAVRCENADLERRLAQVNAMDTSHGIDTVEAIAASLNLDDSDKENTEDSETYNTPDAPKPHSEIVEQVVDDFADIHEADKVRSKRLSYILNTLKNLPDHKTTIVLGDSNHHCIVGDEVDPVYKSVAVRSFSGLCIVSAAYALQKHEHTHSNIKRAVFGLGTNDELHKDQHCEEEFVKHLKTLHSEASRVFPQAHISFILPFHGINGVTFKATQDLASALKVHCPSIWRCRPPSMVGKMNRGGIHINSEGKRAYTEYLMKNFTKCTPDQLRQSQPQHRPKTSSGVRGPRRASGPPKGRGPPRGRGPPKASGPSHPARVIKAPPPAQIPSSIPVNTPADQQSAPAQALHSSSMVKELAEALAHIMMYRRGPQMYTTPAPWNY